MNTDYTSIINFEELEHEWKNIWKQELILRECDQPDLSSHSYPKICQQDEAWTIISKGLLYTLLFRGLYPQTDTDIAVGNIELFELLPNQSIEIPCEYKFEENIIYVEGEQIDLKMNDDNVARFGTPSKDNAKALLRMLFRYQDKSSNIEVISATAECIIGDIYHKKIQIDISNITE